MGLKYLFDTNTIIYYLQGQLPDNTLSLIDNIIDNSIINISVITEIELLCWKTEKKRRNTNHYRFYYKY